MTVVTVVSQVSCVVVFLGSELSCRTQEGEREAAAERCVIEGAGRASETPRQPAGAAEPGGRGGGRRCARAGRLAG